MITEQVALQLIKYGPNYRVIGWRNFLELRALVKCQPSRLLNSQWAEWQSHRSTPPDIQVESTYENCINAAFCMKDSHLALEVIMYDGNLLDGQWERHRCSWLILPELEAVWIQSWLHFCQTLITQLRIGVWNKIKEVEVRLIRQKRIIWKQSRS